MGNVFPVCSSRLLSSINVKYFDKEKFNENHIQMFVENFRRPTEFFSNIIEDLSDK